MLSSEGIETHSHTAVPSQLTGSSFDPDESALHFDFAEAEPAHGLRASLASILRKRTCRSRTILLPDIDPASQRHRREASKLISSLVNGTRHAEPEGQAQLILGASCRCHPRMAQAFHQRDEIHYRRPDFRRRLEDCLAEYCDPPLGLDYELVEVGGGCYGIAHIRPPMSLPVYFLQTTQAGFREPTVWIRVGDENQPADSRRANSEDVKGLFLRYLKTLQPFLDDREWLPREQAFERTACRSAYDLVCALAGFLLADHVGDREMAVRALGEVGGLSKSTKIFAAQLLLGMTTDEDRNITYRAIEALSRRGSPEQAKMLMATLGSIPTLDQQLQAIAALGLIGDRQLIDPLRELQEGSEELEISYAVDQAVAQIRARFGLSAYDVAKMNRFQARISACDYSLAERELNESGSEICEGATQLRWVEALTRIAGFLWKGLYDEARDLAARLQSQGDTPDERFAYWMHESTGLDSPWNRLRVVHSRLEKEFLNHRFSAFLISVFNFSEQLLRVTAEGLGARFDEEDPRRLAPEWLEENPSLANLFREQGLNPRRWLGRRALLTLAQWLVAEQPDYSNKDAQAEALSTLQQLLVPLTPLRNRRTHSEQAVDYATLATHLESRPKEIAVILHSSLENLSSDSTRLNHFDLINSDIRHWLSQNPGGSPRRDLTMVFEHSLETSPGLNTGVVTEFRDDGGYGFVRPESGDDEIFVHITDVIDADQLMPLQRVAYNVEFARDGPRAIQVTVIS